jgi:DNA-binding beta-propeller fold protein YncE
MRRVILAAWCCASATLVSMPGSVQAGRGDILIGMDSKTFFDPEGMRFGPGGHDILGILDVTNPGHPALRASLPLTNSVLGPPTNLQITPDGRLGLLANSVLTTESGGKWTTVPDDKLYVIDLAAEPKLADTLTVGKQPSGLAIAHDGSFALIANRAGKSVSVLRISDGAVRVGNEVPIGDEVAAVAILPDGKRAFVAKNTVNKVGVLSIEGEKIIYDKTLDIPMGGFNVYNLDTTPDGRYVLAANTGLVAGHADTITVIDAVAKPPRAVNHVSVGDGPEGFAISPDGKWAVTPLLLGSSAKHADWSYHRDGSTVLLDLANPEAPRIVNALPAGAVPEGIAFSPDSQYVYVGNYVDKNLQVYHIEGGKLTDTGVKLALQGEPASIRGPAR